ncbi:UNVERIFIED_ORG: hypothetical protein M2348_000034 [Sphingomonas sp. R1F5B]
MDSSDYERSVALMCPTCGGTAFAHDPEVDGPLRCVGCDRELTRDELRAENGEVIAAAFDELTDEALSGMHNDLRNALKSAFKDFKHARFE